MFEFTIRGSRGTIPICGRDFVKYGGKTTCLTLQTNEGMLIFDAGTGIMNVTNEWASLREVPPTTLLFTHLHIDHIMGMPCFRPLYDEKAKTAIMADPKRDEDWKAALRTFMNKPFWPVALEELSHVTEIRDLPADKSFLHIYGVKISWFRAFHPQQCLVYRVEMPNKTITIATDVGYSAEQIDPAFINFCQGSDCLIYDSQFTPEEYPQHKEYGHSTWKAGVHVAREADVKELILTHHAPNRKDNEIDSIVALAKREFPSTCAASENMIL